MKLAADAEGDNRMTTAAIELPSLTRRGVLAAATTALVVSAAGCGENRQAKGESVPTGQALVIGASLELTGRGSDLGSQQEHALRIATERLNADGVPVGRSRRPVRLVVRDNKSDPALAVRHATELAKDENVQAIIGGTLTETSLAIIAVAQQWKVPFLSLASGDAIAVPTAERTYVFKLAPDTADVARRLAQAVASQKLHRVAVLTAAGQHGNAGAEALPGALRTAGLRLDQTERLPMTGGDFRPVARQVAASRPDAVVVWAAAPDSGAAARALRRSGYRGAVFFDTGAVAEETLQGPNAAAVEGAFAVHPMSLSGSTLTSIAGSALAQRDFIYRYLQRYGQYHGFAPYASDGLELVAAAARLADSLDRGRIRAFLETQVIEGMAGWYAFTPTRHGGMEADSLAVFTVTQRAWTRIS
jgi:branched-chain amino acid transport system substrate-binding protein